MRYKCPRCRERRCRTHCRCGRDGSAQGRRAPRPQAKPKAMPKAQAAPPAAVAAPVGRPAALAVEVLGTRAWWDRLLREIRDAAEVALASYIVDHEALCELLLRRLEGRDDFALAVLVDNETFLQRTAFYQRPRLERLRRAGAEIRLCRGPVQPYGSFHMKAIVLDRRVAFTGSANATQKSLQNTEVTMRLVGPPVAAILAEIQAARVRGALWDGTA